MPGRIISKSSSSKSVSKPSSAPSVQHYTSAPVSPSIYQPTLGQSMKQGFGLGFGSAIANRVVSGIFGAPTVNVHSDAKQEPIKVVEKFDKKAFEACMEENYNNYDSCKKYLDVVN